MTWTPASTGDLVLEKCLPFEYAVLIPIFHLITGASIPRWSSSRPVFQLASAVHSTHQDSVVTVASLFKEIATVAYLFKEREFGTTSLLNVMIQRFDSK